MLLPERVAKTVFLTLIYILSAKVGLSLAFEQANASPVWPATGIAIAALILGGRTLWPAILLGSFISNLSFTPAGAGVALMIALGNTLEAVAGATLLRRYLISPVLGRIRHVGLFMLMLMPVVAISATPGVASLWLANMIPTETVTMVWAIWWLGDFMGGLIFIPLLMAWRSFRISLAFSSGLEAFSIALVFVWLCIALFTPLSAWSSAHLALDFLFVPLLVWVALRFQHRGVTLLGAALTLVSVVATLQGYGPFVAASENDSLMLLQLFNGVVMLTGLMMAAGALERKEAKGVLLATQSELEQRVIERTQELSSANQSLASNQAQLEHSIDAMRSLLAASAIPTREEFFSHCVRELAHLYRARFALIGVFDHDSSERIRTLAVWSEDHWAENFVYDLAGTPCADVLNCELELLPSGVAEAYPDDLMLRQMGVTSYFGAVLRAPSRKVMGLVAVMDGASMELLPWVRPVLKIFADRIASELEREEARKEQELADSVFRSSVEAIVVCDAQRNILRVNPAFTRITGYAMEEVLGQNVRVLQSGQHSSDFYREMWESLSKTGLWQGEISDRRKNGELVSLWQTINTVKDPVGNTIQYISIFSDITEKKLSEERIFRLANFDNLTGLPNRISFQNRLSELIQHARHQSYGFALMFMDLDHFKMINDTAGHSTGDELLQQVAQRLREVVREDDMVARLGGDEFTLLLTRDDSNDKVSLVAERVLAALSRPYQLETMQAMVSISIGIAMFPNDGQDAASLLKNADVAMYRAKDQGRNNYQFFMEEMNRQAIERMALASDLLSGMERNEFHLVYQPQFDLNSGRLVGCEALLRWQHPTRGMISPAVFIPVAEQTGAIEALGRWVLEAGLMQCQQWRENGGKSIPVAINLSVRQLMDDELPAKVAAMLSASGLMADQLELEITESMLMENVDKILNNLNVLRGMGIMIAIDDFGTGYSSLAYLKKLPIDKLKIDRSFVSDIMTNPDSAKIVSATIALGKSLNLKVIAEGIETEEQLQFLRTQGSDEGQGYYLSKPISPEQLQQLLRAQPCSVARMLPRSGSV